MFQTRLHLCCLLDPPGEAELSAHEVRLLHSPGARIAHLHVTHEMLQYTLTRDTHPAPLVVGEHLHVALAGTLPLPQPHQLAAGRSCHQVNIAGQDYV